MSDAATIEDLKAQIAALQEQIEGPDTELLSVISAAVAGYLGERAVVKQIRFKRGHQWADQGRRAIMSGREFA
ncbi:hypothetical protein [Stomatohabitans albus]|uniref:hypothetical protein n=1 Tax=Stomatohabitans albus TaxID=3110766 RepID=UPI00300D18B0